MNETSNIGSRARLKNVSSIGRMKHGGKHRCLAGIVAVAAMSAACTASPPSASAPAAPGSAATRVHWQRFACRWATFPDRPAQWVAEDGTKKPASGVVIPFVAAGHS